MTIQHAFVVQEAGTRLDRFLADRLRDAGLSREKLKGLIREGKCLLDGKPEYSPKTILAVGVQVTIQVESPPTSLKAEPGDLEILYRDAVLAVLNKPAGLTVHPAPGRPTGTLAHRLLSHFPELEALEGFRPGIVHRLDKDTSGLMLIALSEQCRLALAGQFARHEVYKEYLALVRGVPARKEETIEVPIGRHPTLKTKMAVIPGGKPAKSARRTLFADPRGRFSLQAVRIFSGRTHQVRVHMQHIGHPLLGDPLYGGQVTASCPCRGKRQMLHAWRLSFTHPLPGGSGSAWRDTSSDLLCTTGQDQKSPAPSSKAAPSSSDAKLSHYPKKTLPPPKGLERDGDTLSFRCPPPTDFIDTVRACLSRSLPVVITGSPGCGKSLLLQFFREQGFPVFSADAEVARLYKPGEDGARLLRARFGDRFVPDASGPVDKAALGSAMRESEALRREVEAMLHPLVWHAVASFWKTHEDTAALSIAEIPLYLESGRDRKAAQENDPPLLVGVSCPFSVRAERLALHRGWSGEVIAGMEAWQWPEDKKMQACDLVIDNSGSLNSFNRNAQALLDALLDTRRERHEAATRHVQSLW
jgi:23S rRNA pseudouridine1911/1915/1917 synthase